VNGESGDGKDNIAYTECSTVGDLVNDLLNSENSEHNTSDGNTIGDGTCGDDPCGNGPCGDDTCGGDDLCGDEIRPVEYDRRDDNDNATAAGPPQNQDVASSNEEQTLVNFIRVFSS